MTNYIQPLLLAIGSLALTVGIAIAGYQLAEAWTPISGWVAFTILMGSQTLSMAMWIPKNYEVQR